MAKTHNDITFCPLFNRDIMYGKCYEVQEILNNEMDINLALEQFDVDEASWECEKCQWYIIPAKTRKSNK